MPLEADPSGVYLLAVATEVGTILAVPGEAPIGKTGNECGGRLAEYGSCELALFAFEKSSRSTFSRSSQLSSAMSTWLVASAAV